MNPALCWFHVRRRGTSFVDWAFYLRTEADYSFRNILNKNGTMGIAHKVSKYMINEDLLKKRKRDARGNERRCQL
jgi:hypothetical protein